MTLSKYNNNENIFCINSRENNKIVYAKDSYLSETPNEFINVEYMFILPTELNMNCTLNSTFDENLKMIVISNTIRKIVDTCFTSCRLLTTIELNRMIEDLNLSCFNSLTQNINIIITIL